MSSEMFLTLLVQATQLILNLRRAAAREVTDTFDMNATSPIRPELAKGLIFAQPSSSDTLQGDTVTYRLA